MITLDGKTAIVTGAGSGIGAAIAKMFAEAGAHVFAADIDEKAALATSDRITTEGGRCEPLTVDVSSETSCETATSTVLERSGGRCDVLVNNAGIGHVGSILSTTPADMDRLWRVNVLGAYFMSRALIPKMIHQGKGSIIHIASIAGLMGMEARFAYTTTKHAIVGMTRAMAMDHGTTGVRINCICPGRVITPFVDARLREYPDPEEFRRQLEAPHVMKRMAQPSEIASAALYLASDAASFVTGSAMTVDGGYTTGK